MHDTGDIDTGSEHGRNEALGILDVRYAKGEITTEEYKSIKNEILSR